MNRAYCLARECTEVASTALLIMFCMIEIGSRYVAWQCRRQNIREGRHA